MTETDRVYSAALIEAKASVWNGVNGFCIAVTDSDPWITEWLFERYGGYRPFRHGAKCWRWRAEGETFEAVVADIVPYLKFRREEFVSPPPPRSDRGFRRLPVSSTLDPAPNVALSLRSQTKDLRSTAVKDFAP